MGLRRHFITGEWESYDDTGKRQVIVYEGKKERSSCGAISSKRPFVSQAMGVIAADAARFNAAARRNKTGAFYNEKGNAVFTSKESRRREMAARHMFDNNAGYGDQAPQSF